jgi:hypothetical protein
MADEFNILDQGPAFSDPALEASAASIDTSIDVNLSTRASEVTLADIKADGRNSAVTIIPLASFTATQTTADQPNLSARGCHLILDVTAIATTLILKVQGKDLASGKYYDMLISQNVNSAGTRVFKIYPGVPAANNLTASDGLPLTWRVVITPSNANNATYSLGVNYLQ